MANGVLGYLAITFAARLGLPPHLNFMLLVAWFGALGVVWWRTPSTSRHEGPKGLPTEASLTA